MLRFLGGEVRKLSESEQEELDNKLKLSSNSKFQAHAANKALQQLGLTNSVFQPQQISQHQFQCDPSWLVCRIYHQLLYL